MKEKREQSLYRMMSHYMDAFWEYDPVNMQVSVQFDKMTPEYCGQSYALQWLTEQYERNYVFEQDRSLWRRLMNASHMEEFLNSARETEQFYIRFSGEGLDFEWHEIHFDRGAHGNICLSSRNVNEKLRNASVSRFFKAEFDYIVCIDVERNSYVMYFSRPENKQELPPVIGSDYQRELYEYNYQNVLEEEREALTRNMELSHVLLELQEKEEYVLYATVWEHGRKSMKKLRFKYMDEEKKMLLLSRTDISDIVKANNIQRELSQGMDLYEEKKKEFLEHMPIAYCTTKVLLDEHGAPYDFVYTYSNREHSRLENVEYGELAGKSFYQFFKNADKKWLKYYYETAFCGIRHVLDEYSPEIDKHLLIYTYQSEPGYCGCVVQDVTEERRLAIELAKSKERTGLLLRYSTDTIVEYDIDSRTLHTLSEDGNRGALLPRISNVPEGMADQGLLDPDSLPAFREAIEKLEQGENQVSFDICARFSRESAFCWYHMSFFAYEESYTGKRKVLGYLKNIDQLILQQQQLKNEAESDPLTGILNVKTGRNLIEHKLRENQGQKYSAMFLFDLDEFKQINDTRGHQRGDQTLIHFTSVLEKIFRANDIVYRLGGDEFAAFIGGLEHPDDVIGRIMNSFFAELQKAGDEGWELKSSVGIYVSRADADYNWYYAQADRALYETKEKRKNSFTVHRDGAV